MAFVIPTKEPKTVVAGDRWQWRRTDLVNFPATTWGLTYYFRSNSADGQFDITAAADGTSFSIDVPPSTTVGFVIGTYYWSAFVTLSTTDRKLIGQGKLELLVDPSSITAPVDGRSHNRRTLDSILAVIERRATTDQQRYVFQAVGRSVDRMPIDDLLKFRDYYAALVAQEEQAAAIANGEGTGRFILVKF